MRGKFMYFGFRSAQESYDYDISMSPADNLLYLSHAKKHQIWKIETLDGEKIKDPRNNWKPIVGTGERCLPGSVDNCGDGGQAVDARLDYPKSVAISIDKTMYISDGRSLRVVSPEGQIETLIVGTSGPAGPPKPPDCQRIFVADEMRLQWPSKLALSPLDNSLHIVDDSMILRLTPDMRLQIVAGMSPLCDKRPEDFGDRADQRRLGPISDIDFASDGTLYILETLVKKGKKSTIYFVDRHRQIQRVKAHFKNDNVSNGDINILKSTISIAVSPDDGLYFASSDRLARMTHSLPERDVNGDIRVADRLLHQVYTFNRLSQHISTHNSETGQLLYSFTYSKNTVLGRLAIVSDSLGNKIAIHRDYTNKVQSIENTFGKKYILQLTTLGHLKSMQLFGNEGATAKTIELGYEDDSSGLLISKHLNNGDFTIYEYDEHGRAKSTAISSGDYYVVSESKSSCSEISDIEAYICLDVWKNGELLTKLKVHQSGKTFTINGKINFQLYETNLFLLKNLGG